jgi:hypothetical protein
MENIMEKIRSFSLLVLLLFSVIISATALNPPTDAINLNGQSNTWLGDYQIKELPATVQNGHTMRTFELTYANAAKTVMIYLDERSDCREYVVRSKNLEVRYVCNKNGFGAKLVSGKLRQYDPDVNALFLASDEFRNQGRISDGGLELSSALGLIASYYPGLLKTKNLLD